MPPHSEREYISDEARCQKKLFYIFLFIVKIVMDTTVMGKGDGIIFISGLQS